MANKVSNYPQAQVSAMPPEVISDTVQWLNHLRTTERPRSNEELRARIDWFFDQCIEYGRRPTVEALCVALHTSRQGLWKAKQKSDERAQILNDAWGLLAATMEAMLVDNTVNTVAGIFLMKSQFQYRDVVSIEQTDSKETLETVLPSKADIIKRLPKYTTIDDDPEIDL